jgi:hypothetical protein
MNRTITIFTGSEYANRKVDTILHDAGFKWDSGQALSVYKAPTSLARTVRNSKVKSTSHEKYNGGHNGEDSLVYHHLELTLELALTFPGAKELPPKGPFSYKGDRYEIDGDKKREVVPGDYFIDGAYPKHILEPQIHHSNGNGFGFRWILKLVESKEKQALTNQFKQLEEDVEELKSTISNMK